MKVNSILRNGLISKFYFLDLNSAIFVYFLYNTPPNLWYFKIFCRHRAYLTRSNKIKNKIFDYEILQYGNKVLKLSLKRKFLRVSDVDIIIDSVKFFSLCEHRCSYAVTIIKGLFACWFSGRDYWLQKFWYLEFLP